MTLYMYMLFCNSNEGNLYATGSDNSSDKGISVSAGRHSEHLKIGLLTMSGLLLVAGIACLLQSSGKYCNI